jgi:FKBP-type peptidyl-prolyl cis-trans isomerase
MKLNFLNYGSLILIASIVGLSIVGCDNKHPGYTRAEPGVYYKLHDVGDTEKKAGDDDVYEVRMSNAYGGIVFYDSEVESPTGTIFMQSSASRYFSVLNEGDSASFLLPGGDLSIPGAPDTALVEMRVRIVRILSSEDYAKVTASFDPEANEHALMDRYALKHGFTAADRDGYGMYFRKTKSTTGMEVDSSVSVTVHYKGYFLNGRVIDNSRDANRPLMFKWGEKGQVVQGVEYALKRMRSGEQAKIIIPSRLAFGSDGSSTGIIPAYTPVVFELELTAVTNN